MATPDTALRDDLTKLADELTDETDAPRDPWERGYQRAQRILGGTLRRLLAAHPASEPDAEMQTQARICPICYDDHSARQRCTPAPVSDTRREGAERAVRQYVNDWCADFEDVLNDPAVLDRHVADLTTAVLTVLPAPPVVDAEAAVMALLGHRVAWGKRNIFLRPEEAGEVVRIVLTAARLRGDDRG